MAKAALSDADLGAKMQISSANSHKHLGGMIPQTFYYFGAFAQLGARQLLGDVSLVVTLAT